MSPVIYIVVPVVLFSSVMLALLLLAGFSKAKKHREEIRDCPRKWWIDNEGH